MRTIFLAYLVILSRHIVRAYIRRYSDSLFDWYRSTKMRLSFGVIDDPPSRDI
jgi:hypothetical protein